LVFVFVSGFFYFPNDIFPAIKINVSLVQNVKQHFNQFCQLKRNGQTFRNAGCWLAGKGLKMLFFCRLGAKIN